MLTVACLVFTLVILPMTILPGDGIVKVEVDPMIEALLEDEEEEDED